MTALEDFQRLECGGSWQRDRNAGAVEAIVSLGEATLTITDLRENVLAHWSLAAVSRANGTTVPAVYHPYGDPGETLTLQDDATEMIDGIERVRRAIARRRPHHGRLRVWLTTVAVIIATLGLALWAPGALLRHTAQVLPDVQRAQLGSALLHELTAVTGPACQEEQGAIALDRLSLRLLDRPQALVILPEGDIETGNLPGGLIVISARLLDSGREPAALAGHILAETLRSEQESSLLTLLEEAGLVASLRLLTSGRLPESALRAQTAALLDSPPLPVDAAALLDRFAARDVPPRPFIDALNPATPLAAQLNAELARRQANGVQMPARTVLRDGDWVRLLGICTR